MRPIDQTIAERFLHRRFRAASVPESAAQSHRSPPSRQFAARQNIVPYRPLLVGLALDEAFSTPS